MTRILIPAECSAVSTGHVFADWEVFDTAHCMDRLVSPCAAALDVVESYRRKVDQDREQWVEEHSDHYAPDIAAHVAGLTEAFDMPGMPQRIEDQLHQRVRDGLNDLKRGAGNVEADRVKVLSGLIAARVLGRELHRDGGRRRRA